MGGFDLLNLLRLSIGVLNLLSKLANVGPVLIDGFRDKFLFFLILPE